jgi:hypothetical protein
VFIFVYYTWYGHDQSVSVFVCLSVCALVYVNICLRKYIFLSVYKSVCVGLSVFLYVYLFYMCLSFCVSLCMFVCISLCEFVYSCHLCLPLNSACRSSRVPALCSSICLNACVCVSLHTLYLCLCVCTTTYLYVSLHVRLLVCSKICLCKSLLVFFCTSERGVCVKKRLISNCRTA